MPGLPGERDYGPLWVFSQWVQLDDLRPLIDEALLTRLLQWGLLLQKDDRVASTVDIYPFAGLWLVSDHFLTPRGRMDSVYPPGKDSLIMARLTPRRHVRSTLDLCTGSGLQALAAAPHTDLLEGFDLNVRAVDFARFNAQFNRVDGKAYFFSSDLYATAEGQRYDLILCNPPWVPAPPEAIETYRGGGPRERIWWSASAEVWQTPSN